MLEYGLRGFRYIFGCVCITCLSLIASSYSSILVTSEIAKAASFLVSSSSASELAFFPELISFCNSERTSIFRSSISTSTVSFLQARLKDKVVSLLMHSSNVIHLFVTGISIDLYVIGLKVANNELRGDKVVDGRRNAVTAYHPTMKRNLIASIVKMSSNHAFNILLAQSQLLSGKERYLLQEVRRRKRRVRRRFRVCPVDCCRIRKNEPQSKLLSFFHFTSLCDER